MAACGAPADEEPTVPLDGEFALVGNEPFWGIRLAGDTAVLSTPEPSAAVTYRGGRWTTVDSAVWRYEAVSTTGDSVTIELYAEACSDGMSDRSYPYRAVVDRGTVQLNGCAVAGRTL